MQLPFEEYNPYWKKQFQDVKSKLSTLLNPLDVQIDHIGSTSVEGLSAKPIIDIQIGVFSETDLDLAPTLLKDDNIIYYEKYNQDMPERRFFVLFNKTTTEMDVPSIIDCELEMPKIIQNHNLRIAHVHVFVKGSPDWVRHIAFRDYLRAHENIKVEYQKLKQGLVLQLWKDGNEYNEAKDDFIKKHEALALKWYGKR